MEKKNIFLLIFIAIDIIILLTIGLIYYLSPPEIDYRFPTSIYINWNQTKVDDDYILRIDACNPVNINAKEFGWKIKNPDGITCFGNDLPVISGESGSISDRNITITWFDNNKNKKLSVNDSFQIKTKDYNLIRHKFLIFHLKDIDFSQEIEFK